MGIEQRPTPRARRSVLAAARGGSPTHNGIGACDAGCGATVCGVSAERDRRPPFAAVHDVLNHHDPEGLLEIGAPRDEYEPEVEEIATRLRNGQPVTSGVLVQIWERWFGPDSGYVSTANDQELARLAAELDALR